MAKEDTIEMEGIVDETLPDARFRVTLKNGVGVMAYACGKMRRHGIRVLAGDRVTLEMTPYDLTIARITFRHKDEVRPANTPRRPPPRRR
jgi:translation initiation factor IF-1